MRIGDNAFSHCKDLRSVTLPASLEKIGILAFSDCNGLADVYYAGTEEEWNDILKETTGLAEENDGLANAVVHFGK